MDKFSSHIKNILHGFFLAIGTTIAEPSTILPLIVNYFGGSSMLVGFFAALLRGGAVVVQLFAAFHAQSYKRMMPYLRRIFFIRFFSWFLIGVAILLFGENYPNLTLASIGLGLFLFSFSAGFAAIYFREIMAKIFSHKFRGKTMAYRQFFSAVGGLVSGALAAWILESFSAPQSYGYLFIISSFIMALGYIAFALVDEPEKEEVSKRESSFRKFLQNSLAILKADKNFQTQVTTFLLAYGYLIALPFIILDAQQKINLDGVAIGSLITTQMVGAMLSNFLWGNLSGNGRNVAVAKVAILVQIIAVSLAFAASSLYVYMLIFFLVGASMDGNRIASSNLVLKLAPADKRPIYIALQMNIVSLGMFFSIIGGIVLHYANYTLLYSLSLGVLLAAFFLSFKLTEGSGD
ncbi:MAG: MFS transporter [Sulfurimonas sp.]|uniref:MFS transporter n=1 Tax=Sulfurimonas sp. TaxID=2022749 RepID=UPI002628AB0F|nr:MFS transporter [Sulfurimonas sp.]MDD2653056.1 MFS transporter [Sulfurimonas sp.]MDD3452251.1 MFS transporter [Sulfurimonas sp.]